MSDDWAKDLIEPIRTKIVPDYAGTVKDLFCNVDYKFDKDQHLLALRVLRGRWSDKKYNLVLWVDDDFVWLRKQLK